MHSNQSHGVLAVSAPPVDKRPTVVILASDPLLCVRMADVIDRQGGHAVTTDSPGAFVAAVDRTFPVLALVDLATPGDWQSAIDRCKLLPPHAPGSDLRLWQPCGTLLFWPPRAAPAPTMFWTHSRMIDDLAALVAQHLSPPLRYPAGWDDVLNEKARIGLEEFNRGDYFEQHELLEAAWLEETRPIREMYQGILQVGVAFLQIQRANWAGAIKMLRRGLPRLRALPDICQGVHIAAFYSAASAIHDEITALGPQNLSDFDQRRFPTIEISGSAEQS
jgi:hypothetical protein